MWNLKPTNSYTVIWKFIDLSCTLNGSFIRALFCTDRHRLFAKYWFTKLHRSYKCWQYFKNHICKYHHQSHQQSLLSLSCQSHGDAHRFPKFYFSLESLNFIRFRQQVVSIAFLRVTSSTYSSLREYLPKSQVWITMPLFQVKMAFQEKSAQLTQLSDTSGSLRDKRLVLVCNMAAVCVLPVLPSRLFLQTFYSKDLIKLITFTALSRTCFSETSSVCWCTRWWLLLADATAGFTLRHQHLSHRCFDSAMLNAGTVKRQTTPWYYYQKWFWP